MPHHAPGSQYMLGAAEHALPTQRFGTRGSQRRSILPTGTHERLGALVKFIGRHPRSLFCRSLAKYSSSPKSPIVAANSTDCPGFSRMSDLSTPACRITTAFGRSLATVMVVLVSSGDEFAPTQTAASRPASPRAVAITRFATGEPRRPLVVTCRANPNNRANRLRGTTSGLAGLRTARLGGQRAHLTC